MRENLVVTSAYARTYVRPYRFWGRVRVVPRQPDRGRRMSSFLGRKFGQPVEQNDCSTVLNRRIKLEKKYQISINGKKMFKRILSCLFGGRRKVQVMKFAFEDFIFAVGSAASSVGTTLEFEEFRSRPDAKYCTASAFWFFCPQPWFLRRSDHIFPGKTAACSCR